MTRIYVSRKHWVVWAHCGEVDHLKIETRLIGGSFESVMGECVIWVCVYYKRSIESYREYM